MIVAVVAVVTAIVLGLLLSYNKLVGMRQLTRNAWSDVDVYLKRRSELIPNLVATVQGYATHEQGTLEKAVEARNRARLATASVSARSQAEQTVGSEVIHVLALAESYPDLKASHGFVELQAQLTEAEKLIANARQYYNACVRDYNTLIESFPSNIPANIFAFRQAEFFELDDIQEREAPKVLGVP